jgi:glycosyltransferase involved in cell wall biosynthesis
MPGTQEDVRPWLECMDVFCLSSITEGTSMTLLEAGACGLPSVVTDVGGNREIVGNNASGIVVPAGDERAFAEALERLYADRSLRVQLGTEARRRVKDGYSAEQMIRAYEQVYREVLEGSA